MDALVTGATGFIGSHLIDVLRRRGDKVSALVRSARKAVGLVKLGVEVVPGDLDDGEALALATRDRQVIYHLAGLVAARNEGEFVRTNRDGTRRLVEAARKNGRPHIVLVSSLAAGGPSLPGSPLGGDEPPRPVSAYGRSKLAGEEAVRESGLPYTVVRPPIVYGPRDREVLKIFKAARHGLVPICGDGSQELSAVYAPDLAEALAVVAAVPSSGRTYCVCHPQLFTSEQLVRTVAAALGRSVRILKLSERPTRALLGLTGTLSRLAGRRTLLTLDKANELFQAAWTGDPEPLHRDTGWRAQHDLASGIAATAAWYRAHGWI